MTIKSMNDLFLHTLKDIYYAEKQIYKNLPKMAKSAESPDLKRAFEKHREETEHHIERLETIFDQCGVAPRAIRCDAMDGILAEAKDVMEGDQGRSSSRRGHARGGADRGALRDCALRDLDCLG
jgi:ferritin-like metal-binding protein YciE